MSDAALGFLSVFAALGFVSLAIWQWRTGNFIDPILRTLAPQLRKRPLMWFTNSFYAFMAVCCLYSARLLFAGV
ncbi:MULTISPECIES: hypothetical protein [Sphingomonas]|uniref:hypothetical protein n=1 Tax=Sphingomonas TaxID=13687 RepID=UPI0012698CB9|nr:MULTISPECIES: hypothetical protein [Sphingomonas]